jgi:CHC2 zinc finger
MRSVRGTLTRPGTRHTHVSQKPSGDQSLSSFMTIAEWCRAQDVYQVIGRYVDLDRNGLGCCPFGAHHADGKDSHPSFQVRPLRAGSLNCWYCYVWQRGGSLFGFLALYYGCTAKELWHRILSGEQF